MRKKSKKIKITHSKLNKKNKTLLFGVALLIILVVVFAPKFVDLTGRAASSSTYETYTLSTKFGEIIKTTDYDPILFYEGYLYVLTNTNFYKFSLAEEPTPHIYEEASSDSLERIMIDEETNHAYGTKDVSNLYNIAIDDFYFSSTTIPSSWTEHSSKKRCCGKGYRKHYNWYTIQHWLEPIVANGKIFVPIQRNHREKKCSGCSVVKYSHHYKSYVAVLDKATGVREKLIDPGLAGLSKAGGHVSHIGFMTLSEDETTLVVYGNQRISIIDISDVDNPVVTISAPLGCSITTELVSKGNYLYYICGNKLHKFNTKTNSVKTADLIEYSPNYAINAFAISDDKLYYGSKNGELFVFDISGVEPEVLAEATLISGDERITTVTTISDIVYIGTTLGNIFALNPDTLEEVWDVSVDGPIYSIIIPYENAMLAFGEGNKLYLFGEPLVTCDPACAADEVCDAINNVCVECLDTQDCAADEVCINNACAPTECEVATEVTDCPADTPKCDPTNLVCVECLDDTHCTDPTSLCDPENFVCVECLDDTNCDSAAGETCVNGECIIAQVCTTEGQRVSDTDGDGVDEYCDSSLDLQPMKAIEDSCDEDYECESNLCSTGDKCLSYEALKEAVCRFVTPQSDWTDAQDDLYGSFNC